MRSIINKFIRLNVGLILCAISIIMSLQSNLGLSPWDVFHQGISKMTGITLGQANIIVGIIVVIITIFLKNGNRFRNFR
jgi:Predicted membrane protein